MLRFDGVQKAGEGVGELPAVVGVHPSPEAEVSISSKCPRGYVCQSMYLHCLGEKQVLKGCVAPLRGRTPVLIPGVGPGSELGPLQGNLSTQLSSFWQSESIPDAWCYADSDCPPGEPVVAGNGEAWNS